MSLLLTAALELLNEILTTAIVILAASLLLYNLTRDLHNRIARTSGAVLACVTWAYVCDVFNSLNPEPSIALAVVRLQWLGIAFIPSALFHLSDALLATTGLPSRGRRRRIVRLMYLFSFMFFVGATQSDLIIRPFFEGSDILIQSGELAWLYVTFFISLMVVTFINVQRARQRCLTRSSKRRMTYLQLAILTPALGIFPYSLLISVEEQTKLPLSALIIAANVVVVAMLLFLSYPLSFFGSNKPDRLVKTELLHFLLRGPATGLLALATILFTSQATRILGIRGEQFLPFAVVAVVLMWQWAIALAIPYLERWLIYRGEDDEQLAKLQDLSERLLTRSDLLQLAEVTLEACCDYLRVSTAFIIAKRGQELEWVQVVGHIASDLDASALQEELDSIATTQAAFSTWQGYQLLPLFSSRLSDQPMLIGALGIQASAQQLINAEKEMLDTFIVRTQHILEDILLQAELFAVLEGLLPQISTTRARADEVEFLQSAEPTRARDKAANRQEAFDQVRAALRHYWGGPGITRSRLMDWHIVQAAAAQNGEPPIQALRALLQEAIEQQRPQGERSWVAPEWTVYNILTTRFLQGKKVRDVARMMSMSDADFFRKQRQAIETVTDTLLKMEASARLTSKNN